MVHPFRTFSFLLISAALIACGGSKSTDSRDGGEPRPPAGNKADHVLELAFGQTATILSENLSVTFDSLLQDSRCPSDVICVWEGQGIIRLRLIDASSDTSFVNLTLFGGCAYGCSPYVPALDTLGYRFELLSLDPYPVSTVPTPRDGYTATIAIFPFPLIDPRDGQVIISNQHPSAIQRLSYFLDTAVVDGDVIKLHVAYSGGCTEHEFELHMSPAGFFEALPLQADLYLRQTGEPDPCDAFSFVNLSFDLRPIAQMYEIKYSQIDCIALNLYGFLDPFGPRQKITVIYHPDGATNTSWCSP